MVAAPRIDKRLRRAARRAARRPAPAADIHRNVGEYAWTIGLARPSYQQIRLIVNEERRRLLARRLTRELLLDVYFRSRPARDVLQLLEE